MVVGMNVILTDDTRKNLIRLQRSKANDINMEEYFEPLNGKTLTLHEFDVFLSNSILKETNKVFEILNPETEAEYAKHLKIIRAIVNSLTGNAWVGIKMMIKNFQSILEISRILRSVEEHKRVLLYVPQLTVINKFSKMLVERKGITDDLEVCHFLNLETHFSVFVNNGHLVFVKRTEDKANTTGNRAFGVRGLICPGNIYTIKFIQSILTFLQKFDIHVDKDPIFKGSRFVRIVNKNDIHLTFNRKEN